MFSMENLKDFLDEYGSSLAEKVSDNMAVVHNPLKDHEPDMDIMMNRMNKRPFPVQREAIKAIIKSYRSGLNSVYLIAEMGSGKSLMGVVSALILKQNPRVLIVCPPHLVKKWIKEIKASVDRDSKVFNLNGKYCLSLLSQLNMKRKPDTPEFYVIGRERVKTHFQWRPAVIRKRATNYCPGCFNMLLDKDGTPMPIFERNSQGKYKRKFSCTQCGEQLWQPDTSKKSGHKYMPALYIKKRMKHFFDLLIADEVHQYKNLSGQGYAFGILSNVCKYTLCLTGTLMGGYASDLFYLLYRSHPKMMIEDGNSYSNPIGFMNKYGVLERITIIPEEDGLTVKSKKRTIIRSKPGVSPLLMGNILLSNSVFLRLSDMSENLPEYEEEVIELDMDIEQAQAYQSFEQDMKDALFDAMENNDYSLLGSYLNALLSYPDRTYQGVEVYHPHTGEFVAAGPKLEDEMPKETELIKIIESELSQRRKVLVYIQNSNTTDISPRLVDMIGSKYCVKVLRSGDTEKRSDTIDQWVKDGLDVLICNPKLVETGMDLLSFPAIVFYQCGYSTYTLRQASRRSWRINQKHPVKVYYLTYSDTLQTRAMKLIATKLETSLALEGELTDKGLSALSESSDSMSKELARALLNQIDNSSSLKDLWSSYRKKEVMMNCNISPSIYVNLEIEKMSIETEHIGNKAVKVSAIESDAKKKIARFSVVEPAQIQLALF